ncbi:Membrane-associated eicosanoid/glutathione metabolism (MAPEG) protein [Botryosphaeria dothidea]|uniref:Membrane-associated eicosanoid/glutathione metabolism (MAPEG) protein n=1 Tax=Botryosphaeria dothidea TaxID=55169 RepID=A0A8H4N6J5_9PEZI|nr:Membrane-associated eicosanoid/glutathione metabolism (MAPEG) protein [Botryosphaeria dothidea]
MSNSTLLAIPAMYITTLVPHFYAISLIKRANNGRYANANAHGSAFAQHLQRAVPAATLAQYERAERAHRNGLENLPLFAAAVLAARLAGVEHAVGATAWAYVASRVVYNGLYIRIEDDRKAVARSGVWAAGLVLCLSLFVRAAMV